MYWKLYSPTKTTGNENILHTNFISGIQKLPDLVLHDVKLILKKSHLCRYNSREVMSLPNFPSIGNMYAST